MPFASYNTYLDYFTTIDLICSQKVARYTWHACLNYCGKAADRKKVANTCGKTLTLTSMYRQSSRFLNQADSYESVGKSSGQFVAQFQGNDKYAGKMQLERPYKEIGLPNSYAK